MTVVSIIVGVLMILIGFAMAFTPLLTFLGSGYLVIILFFIFGIVGVIRGISQKSFGTEFIFAILSLILGIIGLVVPGVAIMNNFVILYMAAGWFFVRGILSIVAAIGSKKLGASTGVMVLGIILGILEIILGAYSVAHPMVLAIALGLLIGFYFIESGINMIILGSAFSGLASGGGKWEQSEGQR